MNQMSQDEVIHIVLGLPPHTDLIVSKKEWQLPKNAKKTLGEPRGQKADWEIVLPDRRRIHIVEFEKFYKIHWDFVSPYENPLAHLKKDAPHWYELLLDFLTKLKSRIK